SCRWRRSIPNSAYPVIAPASPDCYSLTMSVCRRRKAAREEAARPVPDGRLNAQLARIHDWFAENHFKGPARTAGRVRLLVMIVSDYQSGRYRHLPVRTIWTIVFALLYIVGPIDLIPDIIPGFGWLDDAFVVGLVFRAITHDLRRYCEENDLDPKPFGL
ncbi:YkvA family protein, partial [Candidatus Zixiibacteriota bacterium]